MRSTSYTWKWPPGGIPRFRQIWNKSSTPLPTPSHLPILKSFLLLFLLLDFQPLDPPHGVLIGVPNETPCVPVFELQIHIFLHDALLFKFQKIKSLPPYIANIVVFMCSRSEEPLVNLFPIYRVEGKIIPRSVHDPKVSILLRGWGGGWPPCDV